MSTTHDDDKVVYVNPPRLDGPEHRTHALHDVRAIIDAVLETRRHAMVMQATLRNLWAEDYPVPPEVELMYRQAADTCARADYALARARGGLLRQIGAHANA